MIRFIYDHFSQMIQTMTEPLRNKRISTELPNLKVGTFVLILLFDMNQQFESN